MIIDQGSTINGFRIGTEITISANADDRLGHGEGYAAAAALAFRKQIACNGEYIMRESMLIVRSCIYAGSWHFYPWSERPLVHDPRFRPKTD
jgi:hypothetical protein